MASGNNSFSQTTPNRPKSNTTTSRSGRKIFLPQKLCDADRGSRSSRRKRCGEHFCLLSGWVLGCPKLCKEALGFSFLFKSGHLRKCCHFYFIRSTFAENDKHMIWSRTIRCFFFQECFAQSGCWGMVCSYS